jgi:predicted Zn-dependent peptidase
MDPERHTYANGLEAFVFQDPQLELIRFEFVFQNIFDTTEFPLCNTVLAAMLREGTSKLNSKEIADHIDFYGAYLMPEYTMDYTSLTVYTMRKYVDKILPIIHDILTDSIFPKRELDIYVRNNKQSLQVSLKKNDVLARRSFFQHTFGKNRYGNIVTAEAYDSVTQEGLLALFEHQIRPQNCKLFVAGRIDADVLQMVRECFGENWQGKGTAGESNNPELASVKGQLIMERKDDALQSAIRMGKLTLNRAHADFPAVQFVNTLLGGFFGSRLLLKIREDKGYTYGIGSAVSSLQYTGLFTLSSEVGVDVTQATLSEIQKEFDILRQEKPSTAEVELVRNYLQGVMLGSLESVFSHADKYKAVHFSGLDLSYYRYYSEVITNMTTIQVQDIAIQYFDYDELIKVIVGKME